MFRNTRDSLRFSRSSYQRAASIDVPNNAASVRRGDAGQGPLAENIVASLNEGTRCKACEHDVRPAKCSEQYRAVLPFQRCSTNAGGARIFSTSSRGAAGFVG
jgi:hypothetical protein